MREGDYYGIIYITRVEYSCDGKEVAVDMKRELKEFAKSFVKTEVIAEVIGDENGVESVVDIERKEAVVFTLEFELFACGAEGSALGRVLKPS